MAPSKRSHENPLKGEEGRTYPQACPLEAHCDSQQRTAEPGRPDLLKRDRRGVNGDEFEAGASQHGRRRGTCVEMQMRTIEDATLHLRKPAAQDQEAGGQMHRVGQRDHERGVRRGCLAQAAQHRDRVDGVFEYVGADDHRIGVGG